MTKACSKCKQEKNIENFSMKGKEANRKPRLDSQCKSCKKLYYKKLFQKNQMVKLALLPPKHILKPGFKTCRACNADKPLNTNFFKKHARSKDGFYNSCMDCQHILDEKKAEELKARPSPLSGYKKCNACSKVKPWTDFRIIKNKTLYCQCKNCEAEGKKRRVNANPEKYRAIRKRYEEKNKDRKNEQSRSRYHNDLEGSRAKARQRCNRPENKQRQKEWHKENKESIREYYKNKRKNDPLYKLAANFRTRTGQAIRKGSFYKNSSLSEYLGCSMEEFRSHLQSLFQPGMTWDNYGKSIDQWSLDHILPLFSAKDEYEIYRLCHYSNIQPMWSKYNLIKSDRTPSEWAAYKLLHNIDESIPPSQLRTSQTLECSAPGTIREDVGNYPGTPDT